MTHHPTKKKPTNVATESHSNLEEVIRWRAYEIYEARGREDGHDLEDWLRAEAEANGTALETAAAEANDTALETAAV